MYKKPKTALRTCAISNICTIMSCWTRAVIPCKIWYILQLCFFNKLVISRPAFYGAHTCILLMVHWHISFKVNLALTIGKWLCFHKIIIHSNIFLFSYLVSLKKTQIVTCILWGRWIFDINFNETALAPYKWCQGQYFRKYK